MADTDDHVLMRAALVGVVGLGALASAWMFAVVGRPRGAVPVAAAVATVGLVAAVVVLRQRLRTPIAAAPFVRRPTEILARPVVRGGFATTGRHVTEQRRREGHLAHRAFHDDLTGIANRALFLERADRALASEGAAAVAVLFVDLDDFKRVNDRFGHAAGDVVLRTVALRLSAWVRPDDTVARLGGDEFAVLLTGVDATDALSVAERLAGTFGTPVHVDGFDLPVTASIGVAPAGPGSTTATLLREADAAMYGAKREGKDGVRLHEGPRASGAAPPVAFDGSSEPGELDLAYLPEIDLRTGAVVAVEAVPRRRHRLEVVPAATIPVEDPPRPEGDEVVRWVVDRAIADLARWRGRTEVAVRLGPWQLDAPDFAAFVADAIARHAVDPGQLVLSVPERSLVGSPSRSGAMHDLRGLGCRLAVEQFAAADCPLQRIVDLGVAKIELPARLSADIVTDRPTQDFVRGIAAWADAAGIATAAVGVDRPEQLDLFRRLGCATGRGGQLARPLDAGSVDARLSA